MKNERSLILDIKDLQTFICVADNKSITIASQKLRVNQSTVTKRVSNLESLVNGVLFNRKSRPLLLTDFGEEVYFQCFLILKQLDLLTKTNKRDGNVNKDIKVAVSKMLVDDLLGSIIHEYGKINPHGGIDIVSGWGRSLIQQINDGEVDLAIIMAPSNINLLEENILFHEAVNLPLVVVSKKGEAHKYNSLEMCSKRGWVLHPEGCCIREGLIKTLYDNKLELHLNRETFGVELQLECIQNGDGLGVFPKKYFDNVLLEGKELDMVKLENFPLSLNVGIANTQNLDRHIMNSFIQILKKHYSNAHSIS